MKKQIILSLVLAIISFVLGVYMEHNAMMAEQTEIIEITNEACNAKLSIIKFTCKK